MKQLERFFEGGLWGSRYVVLLAVISSLATSIATFYMASADVFYMVAHILDYASPDMAPEMRGELRAESITHIVEIVDAYLLATVLLIFSLGLYELFISKIDQAASDESASKVLFITSLDDLKARLAKVILMILIVQFFEHAIQMEFKSPLDLLYLAGGIMLIGAAIFLSHAGEAHGKGGKEAPPSQH
ncbi:MAG TPA: YqhA family protein [Gammaproteobacteria bacterium]|nr:YqhA family protein [Gammaproteobacteria bacterium]